MQDSEGLARVHTNILPQMEKQIKNLAKFEVDESAAQTSQDAKAAQAISNDPN